MDIGSVVRRKRKNKKIKLEDLAALVTDYDAGNLSRFERGLQGISRNKLKALAEALGTTVSRIYGEAEAAPILADVKRMQDEVDTEFVEGMREIRESQRQIPVISTVQAGEPKEVIDAYAKGDGFETLTVDEKLAKKLGPYAFALEVEGESMLPEFNPGDTVIVDSDVGPRPGSIVVAKMKRDDAATIKKYRPRGLDESGHEEFELVPLNEDWPKIYVKADNPGRIIGVVVEHRRKLR